MNHAVLWSTGIGCIGYMDALSELVGVTLSTTTNIWRCPKYYNTASYPPRLTCSNNAANQA
jgi:hypothetical protein